MSTLNKLDDKELLQIVLSPLQACKNYKPKMGTNNAVELSEFQAIYGADSFYSWFGLDNELMYAAHKAAGGMTSVYRQIGIGCEKLFRRILQDTLDLAISDTTWSYEIETDGQKRKLSLDGRIDLENIKDLEARQRVQEWILKMSEHLNVNPRIASNLKGVVFEVRQGYKSKDSKRQNGDIANASTAYTQAYFPCIVVLSSQIDESIAIRYRLAKWGILRGVTTKPSNSLYSTYNFMEEVVGYDMAGFFERNKEELREEILDTLNTLLRP